jgi:BirA family transcriptional regulator, biotin operon repressor / biotin---[acetyl-CoA-carboxylase] ligase
MPKPESELTPSAIMSRLDTSFIGHKIFYYDFLESTLENARREALWGAPAGTVIIANRQNPGTGQPKIFRVSTDSSLTFSVILRPNLEYLPNMVMLTSVAVCNSIRTATRLHPGIKWPYDLVINEKIVGGISIENDIRKNTLKHCIVSVEINVNQNVVDIPEIAAVATSLSDQMGKPLSLRDLLIQILNEMETLYKLLPETDYIFEHWQKYMLTLGQKVQVSWKERTFTGTAESLTRDGDLLVREVNGSLKMIKAEEVSLT